MILVLFIYLIITIFFHANNYQIYANIINPIFYGIMLIYSLWYIKKGYIKINTNKKHFIFIIIVSCINVLTYFYVGFIFGFSESPYNHSILSILKNVAIQILPIISIEIMRNILLVKNRKSKLLLAAITVLLILLETNYYTFSNLLSNKEELFEYICSTFIPLVAFHLLYTYLVLQDSYVLSLTIRFFYRIIVILLPILPNLNWFVTGSIGLLSSVLTYIIFRYKYANNK